VAKLAGVSPATIYIYYKDKADMLSQILISVKDVLDEGQETAILSVDEPLEQVRNFLDHLIRRWLKFPQQALFMRAALESPNEIAQEGLDYSSKKAEPVMDLYNRLMNTGKVKKISPDLVINWTAGAIISSLMLHFRTNTQPNEAEIQQMIELSIDAISLR
jgi:AcrR family transcriptional regulator